VLPRALSLLKIIVGAAPIEVHRVDVPFSWVIFVRSFHNPYKSGTHYLLSVVGSANIYFYPARPRFMRQDTMDILHGVAILAQQHVFANAWYVV
jgi:hypothetical protein